MREILHFASIYISIGCDEAERKEEWREKREGRRGGITGKGVWKAARAWLLVGCSDLEGSPAASVSACDLSNVVQPPMHAVATMNEWI